MKRYIFDNKKFNYNQFNTVLNKNGIHINYTVFNYECLLEIINDSSNINLYNTDIMSYPIKTYEYKNYYHPNIVMFLNKISDFNRIEIKSDILCSYQDILFNFYPNAKSSNMINLYNTINAGTLINLNDNNKINNIYLRYADNIIYFNMKDLNYRKYFYTTINNDKINLMF